MLMAVKPQAPLVAVAVEEIVVADREVEQIARCDARRIVVVILGPGRGNLKVLGAVLRCRAQTDRADRRAVIGIVALRTRAAEKSGLELLIRRDPETASTR